MIKTKSVIKAAKLPSYDAYVAKLKGIAAQSSGRVLPALKVDAKIEDSRVNFY